jgi:uncharacterized protein YndB with AHSA1/START domain
VTDKPFLVYSIFIQASPERVWQALTEAEFTREYWAGRDIQSDWKIGSPVQSLRRDGGVDWQGEVLEVDPPHLLSYTFHMLISEAHKADPPSRVTFLIEPLGTVTKLTFKHEHADPSSITSKTTENGWPAIFSSLKSLLETGTPLPFSGLGFAPGQKQDR